MTTFKVPCPVCKAKSGEWCSVSSGKNKGRLLNECHSARVQRALGVVDTPSAKKKALSEKAQNEMRHLDGKVATLPTINGQAVMSRMTVSPAPTKAQWLKFACPRCGALKGQECVKTAAGHFPGELWDGGHSDRKAVAESPYWAEQAALDEAQRPAVSFAIGDVVAFTPAFYVKNKRKIVPRKEVLVITSASVDMGYLEYGVSGTSWYSSKDLVLVARATKASLKKAISLSKDEDEDEDEE